MNVEQWEDTYRPVTNVADDAKSWNGQMFETYGDDIATVIEVANTQPRRVWTWIDGEDGSYIVNGYRLVNRIGYFLTEVEWQEGTYVEVTA